MSTLNDLVVHVQTYDPTNGWLTMILGIAIYVVLTFGMYKLKHKGR